MSKLPTNCDPQPYARYPVPWKTLMMFVLLASASVFVRADDPLDRYEAREYKGGERGVLKYRILKPNDYDKTKKYPLVLFLHGAGERGDDNKKQLVHAMTDFASDDVMQKHPAFVIAPQCPTDHKWVNVDWSADSHEMPVMPSKSMKLSLDLLDALQREFNIDAQRIYVTGLSMGGFGTWDAVQRRPVTFAAAIPVCGGGDPAIAKSFDHIPIWCFHGGADTVVKPARSRQMIDALKASGGEPKYTEYDGVGHNSWAATYANREVLDWLFKQQRK